MSDAEKRAEEAERKLRAMQAKMDRIMGSQEQDTQDMDIEMESQDQETEVRRLKSC